MLGNSLDLVNNNPKESEETENEAKDVISDELLNKPRKSIATVEICDRKRSYSIESKLEEFYPRGSLDAGRKESLDSNRITYAEYYLKTKRSGSLAIPVSQYASKQLDELKRVFELLDYDKDNYLNENDLKKVFMVINPKLARGGSVRAFIDSACNDDTGKINQQQFNSFIGGTYFGRFSRIELKYVFDFMDRNQDGYIDISDLSKVFNDLHWTDKYDLNAVLSALDYNKDGRVCFEDFKVTMNRGYAPVEEFNN